MKDKPLSRRDFLKLTAITSAGASLAACGVKTPTPSPQEDVVSPSEQVRQKITCAVLDGELSNGAEAQEAALEEAINVDLELMKFPDEDLRTKIAADLVSGAGVFDIFIGPTLSVHEWQVGGHLVSLDDFIENDPTFDAGDFIQAVYEGYGYWEGQQWALPYKPDAILFFYRKDLFEDPAIQDAFKSRTGSDLKVPETVEELKMTAEFFTKKFNPDSPIDYGWTGWGERHGSIWWWGPRLECLGGNYFDEKMHPNFNNEAGLKALNDHLSMLQYAPEDFIEYDWVKGNTSFLSGKAAMIEQWPGLATMCETPEGYWGKSEVVGKVGYAVPPGYIINGELVQSTILGGWSIGISKYAEHQDAAFKTIAWLTSKEGEPLKVAAGNAPSRKSVYEDWETTPETAYFPMLLKCLEVARIGADVDAPPVSTQLRDYLSSQYHRALMGELEPEEALQMIDDEWTRVLKEAGVYQ